MVNIRLRFQARNWVAKCLYCSRSPGSAVESATLFLSADGYERQTLEVNPTSKVISDVFLTLLREVKIERVTKLNSQDNILALDIVISNRANVDKYVNQITIANLSISNNVCNPNPIPTFTYSLTLTLKQNIVSGHYIRTRRRRWPARNWIYLSQLLRRLLNCYVPARNRRSPHPQRFLMS